MGLTKTGEPDASLERGFPCQRPRTLHVSKGLEIRLALPDEDS